MTLQRLIVTFKPDEIILHALYKTQDGLGRILGQAERTGDKLLARAAYHRAIDLGAQGVVDACLGARPQENRAWESYTAAYQEVRESTGVGQLLERGLTERALFPERPSGTGG